MTEFWITTGLVVALIAGGVAIAYQTRDIHHMEGIVQEKVFNSGKVSTVTTVNADGKVGAGTVVSSDEYYIFVNDKSFSVRKETWLKVNKGDRVDIDYSWVGTEQIQIIQ
ncbi:hypothetical protein [Brevibacillus laterosporus]|uniref:hypothetical protein n=1 Tax=Brevibacillus laterosporus TaxID=1465 RepID=UPI003D20F2EC